MTVYRVFRPAIASALLSCICAIFIVGCGASNTTGSANTDAAATATATSCAQLRTRGATSGTIQNLSGSDVTIAKRSGGGTVKVTYSSTTRFLQQKTVALTAVQEGTIAVVNVKKNPDNTYTALRVTLTTAAAVAANGGTGGRPSNTGTGGQRPTSPCTTFSRQFNAGNGTPGTNRGNRGNGQTLAGTVGQINGSMLTITDTSGNDYSVTFTQTTQVVQTNTASASDLQTGQNVTVTGTPGSGGVVTARLITILLASNGTPTTGQ